MQAKLTVTGGKANRKEVSLSVPVIVGRSRGAGLTIAHPMVSRQHCEIFEADGLLRIRDLGSTNGTYVSGNKVDEAELRPHDQFTIGPLTFEVDYEYVGDATVVEERYQDFEPVAPAESPIEPPVEDFESAESAEEFAPAEEPEPPMEFVESVPGVPATEFPGIAPLDGQVPDFGAWSSVPTGNVAVRSAAESIPPSGFELPQDEGLAALPAAPTAPQQPDAGFLAGQEPVRGDTAGYSETESQEPSVWDSESNPWEDSTGDTQTAAFVPVTPLEKPRPKKGWWPFGKGKAGGK